MTIKAVPLVLLTLFVVTPPGLSIPAPAPQGPVNPETDTNATPVDSAPDTPYPTVTPFFVPAVFHSDYYAQRPEPPQNDAVMLAPESTSTLPESTVAYNDLAPNVMPTDTAAAMPTSTMDVATTSMPETITPEATTSSIDLTATSAGSTVAFQPATETATNTLAFSTSATNTYTSKPFNASKTNVPFPTAGAATGSPREERTRKAAIIGTLLALGCLGGLATCAVCMRCRMPARFARRSSTVEDGDGGSKAKLSYFKEKAKLGSLGRRVAPPEIVVVPVLNSDAPPAINIATPPPLPQETRTGAWQQPAQQRYQIANPEEDQFEDVTHILDEGTFAVEVESTGSRDEGSGKHRTSEGAASYTADSYTTCESRYSGNSKHASEGARGHVEAASFLSMSPPESPVLQTPKQPQFYTITRPRSRTLDEGTSPLRTKHLSASQSMPANAPKPKHTSRESIMARMSAFSEESEWDVAEAYGARYSKNSMNGGGGLVSFVTPATEHMETVEIGGRSCVLVQGVAF